MVIVYCFSPVDEELALKNAQWMNELGGCKDHHAFVICDKRCKLQREIRGELEKCFGGVHFMVAGAEIDGWPQGANYFFRLACGYLQARPIAYFMWLEPDAIPLKEGWATALELEYNQKCLPAGKRFMGDRVEVADIPLHMSGVGIYCNPVHVYAGEAYRAHEIAWDMAGKDQIIPMAHWTKLIEHAWKHPTFTNTDELRTQIRPEAVVFHSSKDGSLIDLLKSKRAGKQILAAGASPRGPQKKEAEEPVSPCPSPTCDIFIRTYPKDYPWLKYCLRSINKFASGFRKVWIVSPEPSPMDVTTLGYEWKTINDESPDGYLAQQITKLYADVITDYQADYILHLDSDVILTREVTPQDFFRGDKLAWLYTPYSAIETPWQAITEKFMDAQIENEFMRRLPMMIPRWLYPRLREFCHSKHGMVVTNYIRVQPERAFSEFNAIGAYAFRYHHDKFQWVNTLEEATETPFARQFHSYTGITPEVEKELADILDGGGKQPCKHGSAGAKDDVNTGIVSSDNAPLSAQEIVALPNNIWVLKNDEISGWVEEAGRLDHDINLLPVILHHIKEGDTVLDIGAFIGDHTVAYSEKVGPLGRVVAFEPNPYAFQCLKHNTETYSNVQCVPLGTSNASETVPLSGNNGSAGGTYVGDHMKITETRLHPLDMFNYSKVDLIKIDVEGYELKTLHGAKDLIARCRPVMVVEVNYEALKRQGARVGDLLAVIESFGYDYKIIQKNCCLTSPLFDILCTPGVALPGAVLSGSGKEREGLLAVVPIAPPPVPTFKEAIAILDNFAKQSPQNKAQVIRGLSQAGLKPNPKNKKKKK